MSTRKLPNGKWQGRYRDESGRQHTRVFPTRTAARTWAADGEATVRAGVHTDPRAGRITLKDWHKKWTAHGPPAAGRIRCHDGHGRRMIMAVI